MTSQGFIISHYTQFADGLQLDRSMSILERCITDDKRKVFHAIRYAEQTIEYANRYFDEKTKRYIEKAIDWLRRERSQYSWNLEIPKLIQSLISMK